MDLMYQLVDKVADRTDGTPSDPLSRAEVATVVEATVHAIRSDPDRFAPLLLNRD